MLDVGFAVNIVRQCFLILFPECSVVLNLSKDKENGSWYSVVVWTFRSLLFIVFLVFLLCLREDLRIVLAVFHFMYLIEVLPKESRNSIFVQQRNLK